MNSVFGRGLSFPPRVGADGRMVWSEGEAGIRESITVILKTEPGERVGVAAFGAGLGRYLFEPNNPATHASIEDAIRRSLEDWEPRIAVESVELAQDPADPETAIATITYGLVATAARERITIGIPLAA